MTDKGFSGHDTSVIKDFDAIRCDECKNIMKVLKEDLEYTCECGCEYSFAFEEETNETDS